MSKHTSYSKVHLEPTRCMMFQMVLFVSYTRYDVIAELPLDMIMYTVYAQLYMASMGVIFYWRCWYFGDKHVLLCLTKEIFVKYVQQFPTFMELPLTDNMHCSDHELRNIYFYQLSDYFSDIRPCFHLGIKWFRGNHIVKVLSKGTLLVQNSYLIKSCNPCE